MLQDRIERNYLGKYNDILRCFIESVVSYKANIEVASKVQRISFYVAMMLGE